MEAINKLAEKHSLQFDNPVDQSWAIYSFLDGAKVMKELIIEELEWRDSNSFLLAQELKKMFLINLDEEECTENQKT